MPLVLFSQSMRDLEYQVIKLSYVEVDRALAILKTIGYTVVEFKGSKGELAGEYSFTPSVSASLNIGGPTKSVANVNLDFGVDLIILCASS